MLIFPRVDRGGKCLFTFTEMEPRARLRLERRTRVLSGRNGFGSPQDGFVMRLRACLSRLPMFFPGQLRRPNDDFERGRHVHEGVDSACTPMVA